MQREKARVLERPGDSDVDAGAAARTGPDAERTTGEADAIGGQPPYRLRDLTRSQRRLATVLVLLLMAPFVISGVRAYADGWLPSGDDALIVIKSLDVMTSDRPLIGQPSTSDAYGTGVFTYHPGPIEFYVFAIPVQVLGTTIGPLVAAGIINGGALLIALWAVLRRAGPGVAAWAALVLGAVVWAQGTAVLTDIISSNFGGYSFLAFAALSWALVCGDHRLLPLAVFAGTWTAQQHLSTVALVVLVAGWAALGLTVALVRGRGRGRKGRSGVAVWLAAGVLTGAVLWSPVLIQEVTNDPGNITAVARFARDSDRETLGLGSGVDQALRAIAAPPLFFRTEWSAEEFRSHLSPPGAAGALLVVAGLVAVAVITRRRRPDLALLAVTALVVAGAGAVTGSNVPMGVEAGRVNLYRWVWAAAALTWVALGWGVVHVATRWQASRSPATSGPVAVSLRVARSTPVLVLLTFALGAGAVFAAVDDSRDDVRRDRVLYDEERRLGRKVLAALDEDGPWLMVTNGAVAGLTVGPSIGRHLVEGGKNIQVQENMVPFWGEHRRHKPGSITGVILVQSSNRDLPAPEGREIEVVSLNSELDLLMKQLIEQMGDDPAVVVAPEGQALLEQQPGLIQMYMGSIEDRLAEDPEDVLEKEFFLELVEDGYLTSPKFDRDVVARARKLASNFEHVLGEDNVGVWILTPEEYAAWTAGN